MSNDVQRRSGGRSARVREAVLSATVAVLAETGQSGLSISEVASRAGVHETSIYRRWGSRERLVVDALLDRSSELLQLPDTGTLRHDLIELGRALVAYGTSPLGEALWRTMAASADDEAFTTTRHEFWEARQFEVAELVERAKRRGELGDHVDGRLLIEVFIAPIHFRLLLTRQPIDDALIADLADVAIQGAGVARPTT